MKKIIITLMLLAMPCLAFAEQGEGDKELALFLTLPTDKLEVPDYFEVRCIEYRGGTGTVDYLVNFKEQKVIKR